MTDTQQPKSYLKRPEGAFGVTLLLLLGAAGLVGLYVLLPFLVVILTNLLYAGLLAGALGVMSLPLIDKQLRTTIWVYYKTFTRWLLGKAIELDPIGILRNRAEDMREKSGSFEEQIDNLTGHCNGIRHQIEKNKQGAEEALGLAQQAKGRKELQGVFLIQSRQYDRLIASNKQLQELLDRMQRILTMLKKMKQVTDTLCEDMEQTVKVQSEQRKMLLAGYGAYKAAQSLIAGEADQREMFDMAMEKLADEYNVKMAAIENFAESTQGLMQGFDLNNEAAAAKMMARIEDLEKQGLASGLDDGPPRVALRVGDVDPAAASEEASPDSLDELFKARR